jgi:hypothetical protein
MAELQIVPNATRTFCGMDGVPVPLRWTLPSPFPSDEEVLG